MKGCPLCGSAPSKQLELEAVRFLGRQNKTAAIVRLVKDVGPVGLTHEEISKVTKFSHATVSARLHDLVRRNVLRVEGKRETVSGRKASVFVAVDRSDAAAADHAQLASTEAA